MAIAEAGTPAEHGHGHDEHGHHAPFIAHHFDDAEQQFDSGKLGIWVFLVTEVLFFSGLFVAYVLWRSHHPELFEIAHVHLDKVLGGINTVVLLFSSLTMAWAVRCAQLSNNRGAAVLILITMMCGAMFLGVKVIEYSHKWDQGILVRSMFHHTLAHPEPQGPLAKSLGVSDWVITLNIIPVILTIGFAVAAGALWGMKKTLWATFFVGLVVMMGGFFGGVVGGHVYMLWKEGSHSGGHAAVVAPDLILHAADRNNDLPAGTNAEQGVSDSAHTDDTHGHAADSHDAHGAHGAHEEPMPPAVGMFFSIYYCMTGLHAIHIIGGLAFLSWIFYRSLALHWRSDYFGPVDFVGLYWHLVDLIWIFLFPMLYLID